MKGIKFDFTNMFNMNVPAGVSKDEVNSYNAKAAEVVKKIFTDKPGFLTVPFTQKWLDTVLDLRQWVQKFEYVVVLGIGGSALGNLALQTALNPLHFNTLSRDERKGPKIFVLDNVDPDYTASVLDQIDPRKTLFNCISKSGTTAEAMANYLIARGLIDSLGLDPKKHILLTTDPSKGILRKIATDEGLRTLEIPPEVGGRFSVMTPVGLLSAMAGGIDIVDLFNGAKDMYEKCKNEDLWSNPAALNAILHYILYKKDYKLSVMMAYSNRLYLLGDWYRQLWAESLGKKVNLKGETVNVGMTPIKALGATDQHSQVQLYNEGPFDKVTTFLKLEKFDREITIPKLHEEFDELKYLGGKKLSDLLNTELSGTEYALCEHNRPNMKVIFPELTAYHIGQFMFAYEFSTAFMGAMLEIDPYDQPGVELGKKVTYALMGREGYAEYEKEVRGKLNSKDEVIL